MSALELDLLDCGHLPTPSSYTTGYGTDASGARHCFDCCEEMERKAIKESGRAFLYLSKKPPLKPLGGDSYERSDTVVTDWVGHELGRVTSSAVRQMRGFAPHRRIFVTAMLPGLGLFKGSGHADVEFVRLRKVANK